MKLTHLPMSQSMTVNKDDVCITLAETSCDFGYISNIRYILLKNTTFRMFYSCETIFVEILDHENI